jgi:hypothetical protein
MKSSERARPTVVSDAHLAWRRLTTANEPVDALPEDYDVVIRGGPDTYHGFVSRPLLNERRL